ncbi:MAG: valine--tRNA ligase [Pirellulaceae bacterium]|jgi:valyl-tRNA synthetase
MAHEIPNRFDFATQAGLVYQAWERDGCFDAEVDPAKKPFAIVIPPPNVTGALHLGHALNNTLQDIQVRWHRMMGDATLWMPGTDHAGIATQARVEQRLRETENLTRHDLGRQKLIERIWQWKDQYETRILSQLKAMGCSCDWRRTRFTLDPICARAVRTTFFDLFRKSWIYRGKKLVNWDTFLQTAVSDDEVFHETVPGHFYHLRYPIDSPQAGEPTEVVVATTRPETMLGDTAVAVHPDPANALDEAERLLEEKLQSAAAKDREALESQLADLRTRKVERLPELLTLAAMARRGALIQLPLTGRKIPLVADSWAKPEMGSGCVKITPAHDPNDYEVAQRCRLPMINILQPDGKIIEPTGRFSGLKIPEARRAVVAAMEAEGLLDRVEDRMIELAHSDRSNTPIEPYLADQWFVAMQTLAQTAIDAVKTGQVQILPSRYADGYLDWLSEKRDWPVGRQLWWGHQIPIWSRIAKTPEECEAWQRQWESTEEAKEGRLCARMEAPATLHVCIRDEDRHLEARLEADGYTRQEDVLDTWFSSALWPHSTLGWPDKTPELDYFYPTSTLITSRDIITLWVARMVLMGINNVGKIPFHQVYIHPKILDGYGETMSKSKGNGVDPIDVIDKFGPDALRFGLAKLATETQDIRMPVQFECPHCQAAIPQTKENRQKPRIRCDQCKKDFATQWAEKEEDLQLPKGPVLSKLFEEGRNFVNKLWNASRFVLMNLEGYSGQGVDRATLPLEDRWILSRLSTIIARVSDHLRHFRYADASRELYQFAWDDYCSFYLEIAKPRLQDPAAKPVVQSVLAYTLDALLRLLHPIIPFVTESIWQQWRQVGPRDDRRFAGKPWLMLRDWPQDEGRDGDEEIERQFSVFASLVGSLREIRSRQNIAPKTTMRYQVACSSEIMQLLQPMEKFVQRMANAESDGWGPDIQAPPLAAQDRTESLTVYVDLADQIDVQAELTKNQKLLEQLSKQIAGKQNLLGNPNFVQKAKPEKVEEEKKSLEELQRQCEAVERLVEQLKLRA